MITKISVTVMLNPIYKSQMYVLCIWATKLDGDVTLV